ncbi:MAG: 4-alpha-glucanotransferase [Anaerolineae bacterium]|nr:4-alpha-glucanotransferase [Anaerolineae bacterium]
MKPRRRAGILCHPTSLPSLHGIGDLGAGALRLIDFLAEAGQTLWQILPLGPTGYGDSPYQPFSAFAGNPLLIDPYQLLEDGLLDEAELALNEPFPNERVDYGRVIGYKAHLLRCAHERLRADAPAYLLAELADFEAREATWLNDYALFMALKRRFSWAPWIDWPREMALRQPEALTHWCEELEDEVRYEKSAQFLFERQWQAIRAFAHGRGIQIMGDMPIFVGHDSADVWSHQELFQLDEQGRPQVVAGVPPDYFSPTGQLWGNPHYRWDRMRAQGYAWWLRRLKRALSQVDLVRLDHFRGFSGYWEVPGDAETAMHGRWVKGPGAELLQAVERQLGQLPIVAEDLGLITPDVEALRERFGLPGMRVLQFAFDSDASNTHLPHNYPANCVVYTGTHDNDTTLGWYGNGQGPARHRARLYTGSSGYDMHWALIRVALTSVADTVIVPLQDVLGLGSEARINTPGNPSGNWTWRYRDEQLQPALAVALRDLCEVTGRTEVKAEPSAAEEPAEIDYEEPFYTRS